MYYIQMIDKYVAAGDQLHSITAIADHITQQEKLQGRDSVMIYGFLARNLRGLGYWMAGDDYCCKLIDVVTPTAPIDPLDDFRLTMGKYKNKMISEVFDVVYLCWLNMAVKFSDEQKQIIRNRISKFQVVDNKLLSSINEAINSIKN